MITNTFIIRPGNKNIVFIRTDTGKLFKISNRKINSDGHINENDGLVPKAVEVSVSYVAELYARFGVKSEGKLRVRGRGNASRIRRFQKEAV